MERLPYRQLEVWEKSHRLAMDVLDVAERPALDRRYFLRDQLCRAATSVPANIAEGRGRRTREDYAAFVARARGSLFELDYWLLVAQERGLLSGEEHLALARRVAELSRQLAALIARLRNEG